MKTKVFICQQGQHSPIKHGEVGYIDGYSGADNHLISIVSGKYVTLVKWHDLEVISNFEYYYIKIKKALGIGKQ